MSKRVYQRFFLEGRHKESRGSALLIALWAVVFVSLTVIGVARMVHAGQEESTSLSQLFLARQVANNAAVLAMHPKIQEGDPILKGTLDTGGTYEAKLVSEGARLNINDLLEQAKGAEVLRRLFGKWGVSDSEASIAADSLQDWVDTDTYARLNGAEQDYYRERSPNSKFPLNQPFSMVDEMAFVRGMDVVAARYPNWKDAFTVWSDGRLDLNDAAADLIEAVCDVSPGQVEQLVAVRERMREMPEAAAKRWTNLAAPLRLLGFSEEQSADVSSQLSVGSAIWRVESTGSVGGKKAVVCLIFAKGKSVNGILHRFEK